MSKSEDLLSASEMMISHFRMDLNFLDWEVESGAGASEVEFQVSSAADHASVMFFGWLVMQGIEEGAEVLADFAKSFIEELYLSEDKKPNRKGMTLKTVTKPWLQRFISIVEFAVPSKLWQAKINPFDGLLLFYQFLTEVGYEANLPRRKKAVEDLRRALKKRPCSIPQQGAMLTQ